MDAAVAETERKERKAADDEDSLSLCLEALFSHASLVMHRRRPNRRIERSYSVSRASDADRKTGKNNHLIREQMILETR